MKRKISRELPTKKMTREDFREMPLDNLYNGRINIVEPEAEGGLVWTFSSVPGEQCGLDDEEHIIYAPTSLAVNLEGQMEATLYPCTKAGWAAAKQLILG